MRGAQSTEATNTLQNLSVGSYQGVMTLITSSPAECKRIGKNKKKNREKRRIRNQIAVGNNFTQNAFHHFQTKSLGLLGDIRDGYAG